MWGCELRALPKTTTPENIQLMKPNTEKIDDALLALLRLTRFTEGEGRPNNYAP